MIGGIVCWKYLGELGGIWEKGSLGGIWGLLWLVLGTRREEDFRWQGIGMAGMAGVAEIFFSYSGCISGRRL